MLYLLKLCDVMQGGEALILYVREKASGKGNAPTQSRLDARVFLLFCLEDVGGRTMGGQDYVRL